jgi:Protein of unknown function (DUF4239)
MTNGIAPKMILISLVLWGEFLRRETLAFQLPTPDTRCRQHYRSKSAVWVTPLSCENEMADSQNVTAPRRGPPYPPESYHLADEEEITRRHTFISFIDHFNQPYNQRASLTEPRSYARANQFDSAQRQVPPSIDDVMSPTSLYGPVATFLAWNSLPARIIVGAMAYLTFPAIINILETFAAVDYVAQDDMAISQLGIMERIKFIYPTAWMDIEKPSLEFIKVSITDQERTNLANLINLYIPGVSIVLGTYFSMTLGILYDRFSRLQQTIAEEASMLAFCFQVLLDLFAKDRNNLIPSAQSIADQINVLVRDSRGRESMRIIYNDPYANILRIVQRFSRQPNCGMGQDETLVGVVRDCIRQLYKLRSKRMNDEALGLAPTHFDVMTFLSGLLLVGIALGTVATAQTDGVPTELSRILFSALVVCYTTIYEMSYDLNRPFDGIYQLRRSGTAVHFLQIKHIVANHPVLRNNISFDPDTPQDDKISSNEQNIATTNGARERRSEKRDIWFT